MELKIGAIIEEPGNSLKNRKAGWRSFRPLWNNKTCTQCMQCWQFCPENAIHQVNNKRIDTDFDFCKGCGICDNVCKFKAIKMVKEEQ